MGRSRNIPRPVRRYVWGRDSGMCQIGELGCLGDGAEIDHIVPWSEGGTHDPDNLRVVCRPCHDLRPDPSAPRRAANRRRRAALEREAGGEQMGGPW